MIWSPHRSPGGHSEVTNLHKHVFGRPSSERELFKPRRRGKHIPLDVYEQFDGGGEEEALARIRTRSELDNENSPRQIFPLKDRLRLSVMSE